MDARVFIICILFSVVNSELVRKKICAGVDTPQCSIHNIDLEPCPDGPAYCLVRRNKPYQISVDFTPQFSTNNLKVALYGDSAKDGTFSTAVTSPINGCEVLNCPLQKSRQSFNVTFTLNKRSRGKIPLQVKLWNEDNTAEVCCSTFNVRVLK